jgi:hypothetical protein
MRLSDCFCGPNGATGNSQGFQPLVLGGTTMSTTLQLLLVGVIVAGAAGYILRATWKTWFGKSNAGCASGCGKCVTPAPDTNAPGRRPLPMA